MPDPITPQVGEIWYCETSQSDSIVAAVAGQHVVFVSLTGIRHPMLWRAGLPWRKKTEPPLRSQVCDRVGCRREAWLAYRRPLGSSWSALEVVCPYHLPRGANVTILHVPQSTGLVYIEGEECGSCHTDATEIIGGVARDRAETDSMWTCSLCGNWWAICQSNILVPSNHEPEFIATMVPDGFTLKGYVKLTSVTRNKYRLDLHPDSSKIGEKPETPLNMYEFILYDTTF